MTTEISERRARLWWALWSDPGDGEAGELIDQLGAAEAARAVAHRGREGRRSGHSHAASRLIGRYGTPPTKERVDSSWERCQRDGIRLSIPGESDWPRALNDLGPHRPIVLFSRGDISLASHVDTLIAVVGTRRPSVAGAQAARFLTESFIERGDIIVSGGALGIDGIAHRTALRHCAPTIVVGATSLDRHYPREHSALFEQVARSGLLLSENPPGKAISPRSFLARNRLIAAMSSAAVVIECPARSGALSTASHAATLGRELFAVRYRTPLPENEGAQRLFEEWNATPIDLDSDPKNSGIQALAGREAV